LHFKSAAFGEAKSIQNHSSRYLNKFDLSLQFGKIYKIFLSETFLLKSKYLIWIFSPKNGSVPPKVGCLVTLVSYWWQQFDINTEAIKI